MLPKKNKIDRKTMANLFTSGFSLFNNSFSFKYLINKENKEKKISFVVPKNVLKKANQRNLLKRRSFFVINKFFKKFPDGFVGAFVFNNKNIKGFMGRKRKDFNPVLNLTFEIKDILDKYEKRK